MKSALPLLRRHPFPVAAWFERVVAVSFAFPEAVLRPLVPAALELDTYQGLAFVAVAMVWTKRLRPQVLPAFCGRDFFLAGYRVFTRLQEPGGRRLRGLNILRSETDKRSMVWLGNLMTHYHYRLVRTHIEDLVSETRVQTFLPSGEQTLDLTFEASSEDSPVPAGSPFPDWKTARLFAGPMPFTFSSEDDATFVVIEGTRKEWKPHPIHVKSWEVALFREPALRETKPILANAFALQGVDYVWQRGRIIRLGATA